MFNCDKKGNHSTLVGNFVRDLKGLVLVGNLCLVADKDILDVSQKSRFFRNKVNILILLDALGLII